MGSPVRDRLAAVQARATFALFAIAAISAGSIGSVADAAGVRGGVGRLIVSAHRIEDRGMITVGVDTYASLDDLAAIAGDYGHSALIEATDQLTLEGWARQAVMYLDRAYSWLGKRAVAGQPLAWPRAGVIEGRDGVLIAPDVVPHEIIDAQALLMVACASGPLDGGTGGHGNPDRAILAESADDASVQYERGSAARHYSPITGLIRHLCTRQLLGGARQILGTRG
jgi:hypothetical protein